MEYKIMRRSFSEMPTNGSYNGPLINGKILKIVIKSKSELPNVSLKLYLDTNEMILNLQGLRQGLEIFYPVNEISENFKDYFYSTGILNVSVEGLQDGEQMGEIWILFTDK